MPRTMRLFIGLSFLFSLILLSGCGQQTTAVVKPTSATEPTRTSSRDAEIAPAPSVPPPPAALAQSPAATPLPTNRLDQPFEAATAPLTPLAALPPTRLLNGKSVGKLYDEVKKNWSHIPLMTAEGKPINYRVTLETQYGNIVLEMLPEVAPNHVRNFIALVRAGYYDGLRFETRIGEKSSTSPKAIAGGSPLGDGDDIVNVGYWLQHEILNEETAQQRGIKHVPGTVGAVHIDSQPNTACCRFYICLTQAKELDGEFTIFAKVVSGMNVAEKIFHCPVDESANNPKPFTQPIEIKKAVVTHQ